MKGPSGLPILLRSEECLPSSRVGASSKASGLRLRGLDMLDEGRELNGLEESLLDQDRQPHSGLNQTLDSFG